jgi:catechol 2,3-dioxygenase-like lactoylglutathione lyase family enzyme
MPRVTGHATVLLVGDVGRSLAYYRDRLGFEVEPYEDAPRVYGYATRDVCHVHFACYVQARPQPNSQAVPPDMFDAYLWVDDVDSLHEELLGRGAELLHGPVDQGYGLREVRVRDPDGYILAFGKPLEG